MSIKEHPPQLHVPVLLQTTLDILQPRPGESYLDLTAGYGGHADAFLQRTANYQSATLVDRDANAIQTLDRFRQQGATIMHTDFVSAARQLIKNGQRYDIVLVDLGVSSPQLDRSERGFSFTNDGPLDMRMDPRQHQTAAEFVNTVSVEELIRSIRRYGEESPSVARKIATAIVANRPLKTTRQLADVIKAAHRGRPGQKIHPATRTFQAIRIAINDELGQIEQLLPLLPHLLHSGGRVGVISFHSLEDRLVKRYFTEQREAGYEAELTLLTKKPYDGKTYDVHHPRSRSAKFRAAVKP